MHQILRDIGNGFYKLFIGVTIVALIGGSIAGANYFLTVPGSGTSFGSVVVGGIHYAQQFICDLTTPAQCASVSAGGAVKVDGSAATQPVSAASLPLPTGAATSANQTTQATKANQDTNSATTAHTCSVAGYSELGCLGDIDDQVKGPIPAGTNLMGFVSPQANTTGGATSFHLLTAANNNATQIKNTAATLYQFDFENTGTNLYDIRFYDTSTAPAAGVPCNSGTNLVGGNHVQQSNATSPGMHITFGSMGIAFLNGIVVCVTGANADNDNTNATTGANLNVVYK